MAVAVARVVPVLLLAATVLLPTAAAAGYDMRQALRPVRVQLKWHHQFQFAGYYAAIEQGYYRDAGLDVTLSEYSPGVTPIDQLIGGRVEFAIADSGALIYRATGVPLVALAAIFQHSPSVFITRGDTNIRRLEDLRGRRLMVSGGYMNAELMAMLANAGMGPGDFEMVPAVTSLTPLIEREVDAYNAYVTNEPFLMESAGIPSTLFHPRHYGVDFYGDLLITTEAMLDAEPEMVRAFRDATLAGWSYAKDHPADVVDLILERWNTTGKSREALLFEAAATVDLILSEVVPIGYMNEERWRRIGDVFRSQGLVKGDPDLDRFIYAPDRVPPALRLVHRHLKELAAAAAILVLSLLLAHILHLKARIGAATRELRAARLRAELEARSDELTGLPNRRHFVESMTRDIARAHRLRAPLVLLMVDVDHFKSVNDTHGHATGDAVLKRLAAALKENVRTGDIVARLGGEEFAIGCPGTDMADARLLAERLRCCALAVGVPEKVAEKVVTESADAASAPRITISIGIAELRDGETLDDLLRVADRALYAAKKAGRNRVCEAEAAAV